MSIQSASSEVLQKMKRKYTAQDVEKSLLKIERAFPPVTAHSGVTRAFDGGASGALHGAAAGPLHGAAAGPLHERTSGVFVGMDVIVGFPTETESHFEETFSRLKDLPWTKCHVFPYSERPGTKAAAFETKQPPNAIAKRGLRLRELSRDRYTEQALNQLGQIKKTLILKQPSQGAIGLSRDYWPIQVEVPEAAKGFERNVEIVGYDHSNLHRLNSPLVGRLVTGN